MGKDNELKQVFGGFMWLLQALANGEVTAEEVSQAALDNAVSVKKLSKSLLLLVKDTDKTEILLEEK